MPEIAVPTSDHKPARRRVKITDVIIFAVLAVLIVILAKTLVSQLSLRHEVSSARITTDKVIADMQRQDAPAARKLGDTSFQAVHSDAQLGGLFKVAKPYVSGTPVIDKQTVDNGKIARVVSVYYKFNPKKPFFVRVTVSELNGTSTWHLINFSGNASEAALTK